MFLSIFPVWSELDLMSQVYWVITAPATLVFFFLLILAIFGSDSDTDVQTDLDHSFADGDGIPFQLLSLKNIIGFFTMFGWSGLGFLNAGLAPWLVVILSFICGLLMMLAMASLFYFMSKLAESGNLNMKNAIGHLGEVYLTIPGERAGMGKVQLTVQGTLQTVDAITDEPEAIATSSLIEVLDVIDEQILLVKRNSK
ncbi:MAG TPA: hypothetical protein VFC65_12075 [Prolixibacteraceae bacterium]|nr:hypothetical protein [Prolixibacteraceae bacterium]